MILLASPKYIMSNYFAIIIMLLQCSKSRHGTLGIFAFSMCLE